MLRLLYPQRSLLAAALLFLLLALVAQANTFTSYTILQGPSIPQPPVTDLGLGEQIATSKDGKVIVESASGTGTPNDNGQVYIFKQAGTKKVWNLVQVISAPADAARFSSVTIDGSGKTIAVGANGNDDPNPILGAAFIYKYSVSSKQYELVQKIRPAGILAGEAFGITLSLSASAKVLAVGAEGVNNGNGAVFMYTHTKAGYVQQGAPLTTAQAGGRLGADVRVSRDGKVVAAGANQLNNYVGGVFVWSLVKGTWTPMGAPILPTNVGAFAFFGTNLGIDKTGMHLVASAPLANNGAGTVLIYRWSKQAQAWALAMQMQSDVVTSNTAFGAGVAMSWNAKYVVVGEVNGGKVHIFGYKKQTQIYKGVTVLVRPAGEKFGHDVAVDASGKVVPIGAVGLPDRTGALYVAGGHVR